MKTNLPSAGEAAAQRHLALSRRRFLRGLGVCVALPAFQSVSSLQTLARDTKTAGGMAATPTGAPLRTAFVYFPNGAQQDHWWPEGEGAEFQLKRTLQPLEGLRKQIQIFGGLDHVNATPGPDGAGDHARANATFLTGARARKTDSAYIHVGTSIDQVLARHVGHLTRLPSLELSCDAVRKAGRCDSGYSCAYQYNISWSSPTTPMPPEPNPRLVFERLFGAGSAGERRKNYKLRQDMDRSVLDFVLDDARSLQKQLGGQDKQKLDEYLTSVREIEQRIQRAATFGDLPEGPAEAPTGVPSDFGAHMDLMYDLLALAFQTDSTRIATLLLSGDGSNRAYPQIGIPQGHHDLTHHRGNEEMMEKVAQIDHFYVQHLARFLQKLASTKDLDGRSLLDNSMIVYGSGHADGNRHSHVNLPIVLAGGGGGGLKPGRFVQHGSVPATNLFLSMADRIGVKGLESFGDSTGRVADV
jgi:hypothetical protein